MYDIRQFKPTLYALILIGIAAFGLASESVGVWLLATLAVVLNAWLVRTKRFVPMPRLLANVVTVGCMLYIAREVLVSSAPPVFVIGQFLVLLQLVKLWEQRANRDFAQLLVLSLLLVVASAINTVSMWFGLLLVGYLFLSLYCCLLFHLKAETDAAKAAFPLPEEKITPAALRRDQRHLSRSMRRLTGFVATVAVALAVVVFLAFPRGGSNMFAGMQLRSAQTLSGFSDQVNFEQVARITQNDRVVAHVELSRNGVPVTAAQQPLLLRGVTLDVYNSDTRSRTISRWMRSPRGNDDRFEGLDRGVSLDLAAMTRPPPGADEWQQKIYLLPTGTNVLFALGGPVSFTPTSRDAKLRISPSDGALQLLEPLQQPIHYEVVSTNLLGRARDPEEVRKQQEQRRSSGRWRRESGDDGRGPRAIGPTRSVIPPEVAAYARKPEVGGIDENGDVPLVTRRAQNPAPAAPGQGHALDEQIARNIERHLQSNFAYTLDLTDSPREAGEDPLVAFLTRFKKGHCEYFAGAMALMCQSLDMQARVVVGFKTDEYNDFSNQFIVRQAHAHAWVEVLTANGWQTFDPTSGRDPRDGGGTAGVLRQMKHFLDYLQFTYANSIIAYDNDQRENLLHELESRMLNTAVRGDLMFGRLRGSMKDFVGSTSFWNLSSKAIGTVLTLTVVALVGFVGWFLWERWMLRRRAARIGLKALPRDDQKRLARQLGFYDDLLRLLGRHGIARPPHQTPMEFSRSLMFLPNHAYETVRRLTGVFYRVRYGDAELSSGQRHHLQAVLDRLEGELGAAVGKVG